MSITITPLTWAQAEQRTGRRLDRRRSYATDGTEVLELAKWTGRCSGCSTEFAGDDVGYGCHECGHTGRRRNAQWVPFAPDLTTRA